ncbi:MAG: MarR family transcriptional regulator [Oscillospiraceae bacterium]
MGGETYIGPLLGQCHHLAKRQLLRSVQQYDITPVQAHAMLFLIHHRDQEETTQQALEQFLKIRPSTVNGVVARLVEKGFVISAAGKTDARRRQLTLTDRGLALEAVFYDGVHAAETALLTGFDPEESAQLRSYLTRMIQNLEKESTL